MEFDIPEDLDPSRQKDLIDLVKIILARLPTLTQEEQRFYLRRLSSYAEYLPIKPT